MGITGSWPQAARWSRIAVTLFALVGTLTMHGMASGHQSGMPASAFRGQSVTAVAAATFPRADIDRSPQAVPARTDDAGSCRPRMAECLTVVPSSPQVAGPGAATVVEGRWSADEAGGTGRRGGAAPRLPPDLTALGISRT